MLKELSKLINSINSSMKNNPEMLMKKGIIFFTVIAVVALIIVLVDNIVRYIHDMKIRNTSVLLEILPKETVPIKDTEKLIKNIHSMLLNTKWRSFLYGRPYLSFEIMGKERLMKFYIKVPRDSKDRIVDRIYSTYQEVVIREAKEYIPQKLGKKICSYGVEVSLGYHHILRLKTRADSDIIPSLLSQLKDMDTDQMAVIQILARPLDNKWQNEGKQELRDYEIDGIRPKRNKNGASGQSIKSALKDFKDQVGYELKSELKSNGINTDLDITDGASTSNRKTKGERKEISGASEKVYESGFEMVIRVACIGSFQKANRYRVKAITAAFNELDSENRLKRDMVLNQPLLYKHLRERFMYSTDRKNILTASELGNFFLRLPGSEALENFPDVEVVKTKEFAPPRDVETQKNIFAINTYHGETTPIGIKDEDLTKHTLIQGSTGSGKSEWAKQFFLNQIEQGRGGMLLEPHGKFADEMIEIIPEERRKDVIWVDFSDPYPPPFNFCKVQKRLGMDYDETLEKTVDEAIEIFKRTFSEVWSGKNESYISNAIKTIIELQEGTMVDMPRLFTDKKFRQHAIKNLKDPQLKDFWINNFKETANGQLNSGTESTVQSVLYKFGKFLDSKKLLRSIGQEDCIDFKDAMDNNKIIIFRLSKEKMSKDRINFIGGIAIKQMIVNAFARDKSMWNVPFPVIIDEAQNFISESIKDIVHELRKYGVCLILMHQDLEQMDAVQGLKEALYGNVGTTITFNVGKPDAPYFEGIYGPRIDQLDLRNLPSRYGYCKLLVNGQKSQTFNIYTLDKTEIDEKEAAKSAEEIKMNNRKNRIHFSKIDEMLKERLESFNQYSEFDQDEDFKVKLDNDEKYEDEKLVKSNIQEKEIIKNEEDDEVSEFKNLFTIKNSDEDIKEEEHEEGINPEEEEAANMWKIAEKKEKKNRRRV
ncbi:type IV secretion system DNA-binding domain-containing protein [Clostridium sp. 19966]|uniref:type IV secretory system conjugative DNA transfer family protein n=1 Tax=Clostridium sp. 19966 TaxID=2768166 RepID=UPI0028DF0841|nr:type IV secretion system DNA-binding domain-containing protein [Clostridium sp. 19966]MDT8718249.1 type IV secretion system DNA-binding domain-containing protein [Clostridium sp. 19966]